MECKASVNKGRCPCVHAGCPSHGVCCECLKNHLRNRELPACCFPPEIARTDERSFEKFIQINS